MVFFTNVMKGNLFVVLLFMSTTGTSGEDIIASTNYDRSITSTVNYKVAINTGTTSTRGEEIIFGKSLYYRYVPMF